MLGYVTDKDFESTTTPLTFDPDSRLRHMSIVGATGTGKSHFALNLALEDIYAGRGVGFIDPHGDSAEMLLNRLPRNRIEDVVYFSPRDVAHPIAWNLFDTTPKDDRHAKADSILMAYKAIWKDSWGQQMNRLLYGGFRVGLDVPNTTLLNIWHMFRHKGYREWCMEHVRNHIVAKFFLEEFADWDKKQRTDRLMPVLSRLENFLGSEHIQNILCQPKSTLDLQDIMDNKKILIVDLATGIVGKEGADLVGSLLVSDIWRIASERAKIREHYRVPFYLYIEEYPNFRTQHFATIVSEARKYKLGLTLINQYLNQAPEMTDAILGTVENLVVFGISADDAERLSKPLVQEFDHRRHPPIPDCTAYDLTYMGVGKTRIRSRGKAFWAKTLPISFKETGTKEAAINHSRGAYGRQRTQVEQKIATFMRRTYRDDDE